MSAQELATISARLTELAQTELFKGSTKSLSYRQRQNLSYKRARAVARTWQLSGNDLHSLTDKFWALHTHNINALDTGMFTLLTIQFNLAGGEIASHAIKRPELRPILQQILNFDVSAQYLLTELAHGLDAPNLETTATLLPSGEFELNTPRMEACKFMPPTGPFGDMPRIAVVFARLMVSGEDRGVRPFLVILGDGKSMSPGITSWLLPQRCGIRPVDHSVTHFDHVRLPSCALLGDLRKPVDERLNFMKSIRRVAVGSLAVTLVNIPLIAASAHIGARYSIRRTITGPTGEPLPIWSFRTQQLPVLNTFACHAAMQCLAKEAAAFFVNNDEDIRARMGVAATLKAVFTQHGQDTLNALIFRCGARGLFAENMLTQIQIELRGCAIAEGDSLALCIRLASELLLDRYALPEPRYPESLLAKHEAGVFAAARAQLAELGPGGHRSEAYNNLILPQSKPLVEAIGHRMAFEAALDAGVDADLLAMYEVYCIKLDPAWYAEHLGLGSRQQAIMEEKAASACVPKIEQFIEDLEAEPFAPAPMLDARREEEFLFDNVKYTSEKRTSIVSYPSSPSRAPSSAYDRQPQMTASAASSGRSARL